MGRVEPSRQVGMATLGRRKLPVTPGGPEPLVPGRARTEVSPKVAIGLGKGEGRTDGRVRLAPFRLHRP